MTHDNDRATKRLLGLVKKFMETAHREMGVTVSCFYSTRMKTEMAPFPRDLSPFLPPSYNYNVAPGLKPKVLLLPRRNHSGGKVPEMFWTCGRTGQQVNNVLRVLVLSN